MNDLIARLEQSPEGSRELDAEILQTLCPEAMIVPDTAWPGSFVVYHGEPFVDNKVPPCYTTSTDAALRLVPEGWHVAVASWTWASDGGKRWMAQTIYKEWSFATTPALALIIAILKAMQAMEADDG